jgi:MFS family permease
VRLKITETPDFQAVLERNERVRLPVVDGVPRAYAARWCWAPDGALATFVMFYLMTVFALSWGTTALGYSRQQFLLLQLFAIVFFGLTIPLAAVLADRHGRRAAMIAVTVAIAVFGLVLGPMFGSGSLVVTLFMVLGQCLIGMTYGPLGTLLSELFPPEVRYTGASLTFNLAGILGASLAPYVATWLATSRGLPWVGWYLSASALVSLGLVQRAQRCAALDLRRAGNPALQRTRAARPLRRLRHPADLAGRRLSGRDRRRRRDARRPGAGGAEGSHLHVAAPVLAQDRRRTAGLPADAVGGFVSSASGRRPK